MVTGATESEDQRTSSSEAGSPAPLVARCTQCDGDVPLVLVGPMPVCGYCGAQDPLQPDVRSRFAGLRERIAGRTAREQQLVGRQARLGRTYGLGFLLAIVCVWLLVFFMIYFMIDTPRGMSLGQLLFSVHQPTDHAADPAAKWWIVFLMITGLAATLMSYAIGIIFLRRVVRHALPQSPLAPGRPPRCRCCAADLPASGALRRCDHCGADHLVMGQRYQKRAASLDAALSQIEGRIDGTLAVRQRRADRLVLAGALLPAGIAMASPVGLALGETRPALWVVPGILAGLAILFGLVARAITVPAIRVFDEVRAGDRVQILGCTYRVSTTLGFMGLGGYAPIGLLCTEAGYPAEFTHAVQVPVGTEHQPRLFKYQAGGDALNAPQGDDGLLLGSPSRQTTEGPLADSSLRIWAYFATQGGAGCNSALDAETIRIWVGVDPRAAERPAPSMTLHSPRSVDPDQALLLSAVD